MTLVLGEPDQLMVQTKRSAFFRYGLAIGVVVLALLLTLWAMPIRTGTPFIFFFLAVTLSALYGGLGPALVTIALSAFLVNWLIFPPVGALQLRVWQLAQLLGFFLTSAVIAWLVDARRRALQLAWTQREALATTLTSIGDAVIATDLHGRVTWLNPVAATLTGWGLAEAIGQPLETIFHIVNEQTRAVVENPVQRVLAEGRIVGLANHTVLIAKDGHEWAIDDNAAPIRDRTGAITGAVLVFRDITPARQLERTLREREAQLQLITDHLPALISLVDTQERYQFVNAEYEAWFGLAAAQVVGRRVQDVLDANTYLHVRPYLVGALQGQSASFENVYHLPDGSTRVGYVLYVPHRVDGRVEGVYVLVTDITERNRAEQRVRLLADMSKVLASSLDYQATLQQVVDLMTPSLADWCTVDLVDETGEVQLAAVGHVDPAKAQWARELRRIFPPQKQASQGIYQVLRTGRSELYAEISEELLRAAVQGDEQRWAIIQQIGYRSALLAPLPVRGQIIGVLTLVRSGAGHLYSEADLHFAEEVAQRAALAIDNARLYGEARTAESQLKHFNQILEQRVQERTAELARSNAELDQFAYVASHDLKAPLRAISHLAAWISEDAAPLLPENSREHLAKLQARIKRMDTLLDDLLAYSRAGRQRHPTEQVDMGELVQRVVEFIGPPPGFTIATCTPLPSLVAERVPLETVFRNLIGNALKHHHQPDQGLVQIGAHVEGDFIHFTIADNGPGIDPAYHDRIFGIFQTLKPRDQVEGSGIGLTVVKKLVGSRGGRIWVESALGQGAAFHFTWPQTV
jgi:PAS domain S-box-containing protein